MNLYPDDDPDVVENIKTDKKMIKKCSYMHGCAFPCEDMELMNKLAEMTKQLDFGSKIDKKKNKKSSKINSSVHHRNIIFQLGMLQTHSR